MMNIKAFKWVMIFTILLGMIACKKSNAENKEIVISNSTAIKARVVVNDQGEQERLVFVKNNPSFIVEMSNDTAVSAEVSIVLNIQTVVQRETPPLYTKTLLDTVPNNTKDYNHKVSFSVPDNILSAGFYRVTILVNGVEAEAKDLWVGLSKPIIGVKPLQMKVDNTDKPTDFDIFWNNALNELKAIPLNAVETQVADNDTRTIYKIELDSWNGGKVIGYLSVPKSGGKHPTILTSNGYSTIAAMPTRTDEFIEFNYNVRGQGLDNDLGSSTAYKNITWFVRGLETNDKDKYYYKGAYLDVVRAIDYLYSRADVDLSKVFAQGESQGGALTFVAAALGNNRIKAAAASVPFLSYFKTYY
ncbi:MAG: acetylxylan esterase, partial [Anaerovoracaceae bacterium]